MAAILRRNFEAAIGCSWFSDWFSYQLSARCTSSNIEHTVPRHSNRPLQLWHHSLIIQWEAVIQMQYMRTMSPGLIVELQSDPVISPSVLILRLPLLLLLLIIIRRRRIILAHLEHQTVPHRFICFPWKENLSRCIPYVSLCLAHLSWCFLSVNNNCTCILCFLAVGFCDGRLTFTLCDSLMLYHTFCIRTSSLCMSVSYDFNNTYIEAEWDLNQRIQRICGSLMYCTILNDYALYH